jgi:hypothetical protein
MPAPLPIERAMPLVAPVSWLEPAYIEGWALALTFGTEEEFRAGRISIALMCLIMSLFCHYAAVRWRSVRASLGWRSPKFLARFSDIVSNPAWWIVTLALFLLFVSLLPYAEERRWPFWLQEAKSAQPARVNAKGLVSAPPVVTAAPATPTPASLEANLIGSVQLAPGILGSITIISQQGSIKDVNLSQVSSSLTPTNIINIFLSDSVGPFDVKIEKQLDVGYSPPMTVTVSVNNKDFVQLNIEGLSGLRMGGDTGIFTIKLYKRVK